MAKTLEERRTKRELARAQLQHDIDRKAAELRACANAYVAMSVLRRGSACQRWTFQIAGHIHADCHIVENEWGAYQTTTMEFTPHSGGFTKDERTGRVRLTMHGRFIGTIESSSGQTRMVVFNNNDERGDVAYAVAGSGVVGWAVEVFGFDYSTVRVRGLD